MNSTEMKKHIEDTILSNNFNKIGISLSGGLDSSIILYLLADVLSSNDKYLDTIKIIPIVGIGDTRLEIVENVINFVRKQFKRVNFEEIRIVKYDTFFEKKWPLYHKPYHQELFKNKEIDVLMHMGTKNMPFAELNEILKFRKIEISKDFIDEKRNIPDNIIPKTITWEKEEYWQWNILMPYNKKITNSLYNELNLHDSLAKITWSCTGRKVNELLDSESNLIAKPCEKCYWCIEKKWAFGYY